MRRNATTPFRPHLMSMDTIAKPPGDPRAAACVFFDGGCPVCRREIGWYQNMRGGETIDWVDISGRLEAPEGLPPEVTVMDLMRRFTILRRDGEMVSGGAAFIAVWRALTSLRWLGRLADHPPGVWLGERLYRLFLRLRKLWR